MMKKLLPVLALAILLCGCSQEQKNPYSDELMVLQQQEAYTLFDDTQVSHWTMGMMKQDYYCIFNEEKEEYIEILMVEHPIGPEGVRNNGLSFDDLAEPAKSVVGEYYENQGILYDVSFEVENAYAEYERRDNNKRLFNWHYISQSVWPTGGTEEVIAFTTELIAYRGEEDARQEWRNVIFDRETGEQIPVESIFSVPLEEAKALILDQLMPEELEKEEKDLREQMENAFRFEYIKLMNDGVEVMFPVDTLECKEKTFGGFIPAEELNGVIHSWALNP